MKITCMILLAGSLSSCAGAPAEPQQTADAPVAIAFASEERSEDHTSELQSQR